MVKYDWLRVRGRGILQHDRHTWLLTPDLTPERVLTPERTAVVHLLRAGLVVHLLRAGLGKLSRRVQYVALAGTEKPWASDIVSEDRGPR
jgi:hypothetical protein